MDEREISRPAAQGVPATASRPPVARPSPAPPPGAGLRAQRPPAAVAPRPGVTATAAAVAGARTTPRRPETAAFAVPPRERQRGGLLRWMWPGSPVVPLTILMVLSAATAAGLPYYLLDLPHRMRSPLHRWLKPSGTIGQAAGFLALALFAFMWLYPLRKRARFLSGAGPMARWLDVHILVGLAVPWVAALHASWRFEGLIGLGYVAMVIVSLSGVVGKYLYARIPRSRAGVELTLEQVDSERRELAARIAGALAITPAEVERTLAEFATVDRGAGVLRALAAMATADLRGGAAGAPPDRDEPGAAHARRDAPGVPLLARRAPPRRHHRDGGRAHPRRRRDRDGDDLAWLEVVS
jgi:hypothetical protein